MFEKCKGHKGKSGSKFLTGSVEICHGPSRCGAWGEQRSWIDFWNLCQGTKKDRKVWLYILFGLVFYDELAHGPYITKQYGLLEIDQKILVVLGSSPET